MAASSSTGGRPELSVVLPAYKEAEALAALLPKIRGVLSELTPGHEILVVDTQQPMDETPLICQAHGVRYLARQGGNQYGNAVRTGIAEARGDWILMMDADGSHNPVEIQALWKQRTGQSLVIGSRYIRGGATENPFILIFMSYCVNLVFRLVFGLRVRDVSDSFRLYRADALRRYSIESDDFDLIPEILIRMTRDGDPIKEVPIRFERRKGGDSKRNLFLFAVSYILTIVRLKRVTARSARRKES